jgi:hypothetical protein
VHYVGNYTTSLQNARSLQHKFDTLLWQHVSFYHWTIFGPTYRGKSCAYVTKVFRITFYWTTGVIIWCEISPTVQYNTFLSDYINLYIIVSIHSILTFRNLYILHCFWAHMLSNMESHSKQHTLIVPFNNVRWPEHALKKARNMLQY